MEIQKISIIGGGIAGISLAITLQQLGISYELFEKKQNLDYDDVGIGLSANIFPILSIWGIFNETESIGGYIKNFHFVDKNLKYLKSYKLKNPALSVRRKEFYRLLQNKLNKSTVFLGQNKNYKEITESQVLVSADGLNSLARNSFYPTIQIRDSGQLLWRGISKIKLPEIYENAYHDLIGNNLRFAIIHTGQDYYSWYLIKDLGGQSNETKTKEDLLGKFLLDYPSITQNVVENSNEVFFSRLVDINPRKRNGLSWYIGNHIIIGDSIHPTTPNMANSACLSIEDGFILGHLLSRFDTDKAFELFQKDREKKVNKVVAQSWLFGKSVHWNNQVMTFLTKKIIQATPQIIFETLYANVLNQSKLIPTFAKINRHL